MKCSIGPSQVNRDQPFSPAASIEKIVLLQLDCVTGLFVTSAD
jgi:hypothetical protein